MTEDITRLRQATAGGAVVCAHGEAGVRTELKTETIDENGTIKVRMRHFCKGCGGEYLPTACVFAPNDEMKLCIAGIYMAPRPVPPEILKPGNA
jgi:hypothetical protein